MTGAPLKRVEELAAAMAAHGLGDVSTALVLGSGLGEFADKLEDPTIVSFDDIEGIPASSVPGHAGRFVAGTLAGSRVLVQQGRVHLYEGHSAFTVSMVVRAMARLGVRNLLLTNAAGGLVEGWPVPSLMRIRDHLNFQHRTPLTRSESGRANVYDADFGRLIDEAAARIGIKLQCGIYFALLGPSYETPAEVRMLQRSGAHAVGMSTAAEAMSAYSEGMRVAGISCISNPGAGLAPGKLNHAEVVEAGREIADDFGRLLEECVRGIGTLA
ncbi:MAG: purine-nucleoside phosphorylase [Planctomycetota bacterium]